ncbi:hypothetical protein [Aurantiacibacter suaedae]|uniref:hypothetical protein n=1 Tax=Aurantiacibacter suaedae TaxID=2545755 RepID=UPI0010F65DD3|nr:hypothetical protein [Aurantiacibacter suaedae]
MLSQELAERDLVSLYLDLAPNEEVDLEVAAKAAIEWAKGLKAAARALDDTKDYRVSLVAAQPGSKRWLAKIEESKINQAAISAKQKWENVPLIIRMGLTAVLVLPVTAKETYEAYFESDGFSQTEIAQLEEVVGKSSGDAETRKHKKEMFRQAQRDRSIVGLGSGVPDRENWRPNLIIPRNRFAEGDGLFELQEEEPEEKPVYQTLDVILVSPNLDNPRLTWVFRQEGIPGTIKAAMADEGFLEALEKSQVREEFHSPIHMKIKLKIEQFLKDGEWLVKRGGTSVIEVISPAVG